MTSSFSRISLYSMLELTEATLLVLLDELLSELKVEVGTGTWVPEEIIAFLLLAA